MSTLLERSRRVSLHPEQLVAINQRLNELSSKLSARLVVLAQASGQMLAARGIELTGQEQHTDMDALGALIAGDLAASREIARVTGTYEECQLILRQGEHNHSLIAEVGTMGALFVLVSHQTPLGWARMVTLETARHLAELLQPITDSVPQQWSVGADTLTHLVNDSLDAIWTEDPHVR